MNKLIILSLVLLTGCANTDKAEDYAAEYAATNFKGQNVQSISCEKSDSDGNGRVRCNISIGPEGASQVEHVECPSRWRPQPLTTQCVGIRR